MGKEKKKDKEKKKISPEQMLEALRQQNIITSLSEPKGTNGLQYSLSKTDEKVPPKLISELPRAKALRLPASTTDSIPLTGYGGLISTGLTSLRPVGTHKEYLLQTI